MEDFWFLFLVLVLLLSPYAYLLVMDIINWRLFDHDFQKNYFLLFAVIYWLIGLSILLTLFVEPFFFPTIFWNLTVALGIRSPRSYYYKGKLSKMIPNQKRLKPIREQIIPKINKEAWEEFRNHLDALQEGEEEFNLKSFLPIIALRKYHVMLGYTFGRSYIGIPTLPTPPSYIRQHPYLGEFEKRARQFSLEQILRAIDQQNS